MTMDYNAPRILHLARAAAVLITVAIGVGSFILSFAALRDLAVRSGWPHHLAWVWPLIVDGAILMATMAVVALAPYSDQGRSRRFFWLVLAASASVSVGCNALHAVIPRPTPITTWLAAAIAMVPPIMLLASAHGLSLLTCARGSEPSDGRQAPPPARDAGRFEKDADPTNEIVAIAPAPEREPIPTTQRGKWGEMAGRIVEQAVVKDTTADEVVDVLYLSYERGFSHRAIGRQLDMDHRAVGKIVAASSDLLRGGRITIGEDELAPHRAVS